MFKLLTVFNVLAGGASIAGLFLAVRPGDIGYGLVSIFAVTLVLTLYVLLVPGNRLERNVRSKVESYEPIGDSGNLVIQRGEVVIETAGGSPAVEFHEPFAEPPKVELIFVEGFVEGYNAPNSEIVRVTEHQFVFGRSPDIWPRKKARFTWVARGIPLKKRSL